MEILEKLQTAGYVVCSMLAEIVRTSLTGRGDLSELCSHICRVAIFNPCQELQLIRRANNLFRENQDES